MKQLIALLLCLAVSQAYAQHKDSTLRKTLLEEFHTTYDVKDWFVPLTVALDGVNASQANWRDSSGNHSVGQLAAHLLFWNERALKQLKKEPVPEFDNDNDRTFTRFEEADWDKIKMQTKTVMDGFVRLIENATDEQLAAWSSMLSHVSTHNAYHIGEIVIIRKLQGSWNPDKGVK